MIVELFQEYQAGAKRTRVPNNTNITVRHAVFYYCDADDL